jgi:hypothetical protein
VDGQVLRGRSLLCVLSTVDVYECLGNVLEPVEPGEERIFRDFRTPVKLWYPI